jgi:cytochrome c5
MGKKAYWTKRVAQGKEMVYKNSIEGLRGMPAKGGMVSLSDEEVKAAVDYMVGRSGGWGK